MSSGEEPAVPLSTRQRAALAVVVKLVGAAEVPGAGQTIAQQAAGAAGAAAHAGGGRGAAKKVASAQGAAHFKLPIGSLIIPHQHYVKGEPGHWVGHISEAKWIANQWHSKPHADDAAHQAVAAGTHRWVQAGEHEFAVHKGVEVHVPKSTDLNNPASVKHAPKVFIKKNEHGEPAEHLTVHPGHIEESAPKMTTDADKATLAAHWKPLAEPETSHKSVAFAGKHAAWVPHDWQVYKNTSEPDESKHKVKFAKDPEGKWHYIYQNGKIAPTPHNKAEGWVSKGILKPDEPLPEEHAAEHPLPPVTEGPQGGKHDVGGVAVTKDEIQDAISKLSASKSTQIKGLLKGHPLEAADYHSVYKGELAKYPHLKVPAGTKKAHVPEAKNAFIHHLTRKLQSVSNDEGTAAAAEAAQDRVQAAAAHAQELTPHQVTLPHENAAPAPAVSVEVGGQVVGEAPPGSEVYVWHKVAQSVGRSGPKYVKYPDGTWHYYTEDGKTANPDLKMEGDLANGNLVPLREVPAKPISASPVPGVDVPWPAVPDAKLFYDKSKGPDSWPKYEDANAGGWPLKWNLVEEDGSKKPVPEYGQVPAFLAPVPEPEAPAAPAATTPTPPDTAEVTGITVNKEDIQAAIDALNAAKSTAIKQILKAKGNKLQDADYWAVIHAWEAAHPNVSKGKGTKKAHVGNAKTMFIAALQEKLDGLAKADSLSGHDKAAELHDLVKNGKLKPNAQHDVTVTSAIARAAHDAVHNLHNYYIWKKDDGTWAKSVLKPPAGTQVYYKVTMDLKASVFHGTDESSADTLLWNSVHLWIEPAKAGEAGAPAVKPAEPEVPQLGTVLSEFKQDAAQAKAWKADSQWPELDSHVAALASNPKQLYGLPEAKTTTQKLATLLMQAHLHGEARYLLKEGGVNYGLQSKPPAPGTFGAPGKAYWEVRPDHQVIFHDEHGVKTPLGVGSVQLLLKQGAKPPEKNTLLETVEQLTAGPHKYNVQPGDAVFKTYAAGMTTGAHAYYIRHADGTWTLLDKWEGISKVSGGNYKTLEAWASGNGNVSLEAVNDAAKALKESITPKLSPEPAAPVPNDIQVFIKGSNVAQLPAGTKVYEIASGTSSVKYVKKPDGKWFYVYHDGSITPGSNWDNVILGNSQYKEVLYGDNGLPKEPVPAKPEPAAEAKAAEETPAGPPAIYNGEHVGEFPAGSKFYYKQVGSYQGTYAHAPDGKWYAAYSGGVQEVGKYKVNDGMLVQENLLVPQEPPSEKELANAKLVGEIKSLTKTGTVDPAKGLTPHEGYNGYSQVFKTWHQAMAAELAKKKTGAGETFVVPVPAKGGFRAGSHLPYDAKEYWKLGNWKLQHHLDSGVQPEDVPLTQLHEAVKRYVVPDSVIVDHTQYKFGFWKKAKGSAYLEIKATNVSYPKTHKFGDAAYGNFLYHGTDGSVKEVSPSFAANFLKGAEHSDEAPTVEAKAAKAPAFAVEHATVAVPGNYHLYSASGPHPEDNLDLKSDGSATYNYHGGADGITAHVTSSMLSGGMVLDKYGTTVVRPGTPVDNYHLFGGASKTPKELEEFKSWLEANWNTGTKGWNAEFAKLLFDHEHQGASITTYQHSDLLKSFLGDKNIDLADGTAQRDALYQLVKELLAVPNLPEGAKVGAPEAPKEVAYLKSLPPGIKEAKDVFNFAQNGQALPFKGMIPSPYSLTVPELKEAITKISEQFGDGKIVGTHLTMPKYSLVDWLVHWKQGDMKYIFMLDSGAGKVSPAHPGAPENTGTHKITWSPADPLQVPAAQDIPGNWTDAKWSIPAKEVNNYLLAMHFQHGEHLTPVEREQVVKAHRAHEQDKVDQITRTAQERYAAGAHPYSGPLEHTPNLKPAKPYDTFLEKQLAAEEWTSSAKAEFVADHQADLAPYAPAVASEYGTTTEKVLGNAVSSYVHAKLIQAWLDDAHAKVIAEQMVPVWKKIPTGQLPSHGHEVWKATKTIPYTGEQTTWFVKPAPDGKVFRIEQEHAANQLGSLFGFRTAQSVLLDNGEFGQLVQAQKAIAGEPLGHYTDMPSWTSFTPQQVADMAVEHLLDAVLFNDDTSANNMIKTPDGHLVGIDKGRSWGNLDWKATAGNSEMDSMTQLVYTKLYDAIRKGQLSKDVADQAYIAVIKQARKMQLVPDSAVRKLLEQAFAHRTKFPEGGKEALIQKVLDRKNSLEHDFHKMWEKVYQDAGFGAQSEDFGTGMPWGEKPGANARWGLVVFNDKGEVLLREAKNHYGGAAWTFSKGGANPGESPMQAAIRESAEEVKYQFNPVGYVPGAFAGKTSANYYYLASAKGAVFTPELDNGETEQTKWVSIEEAKQLIQHGGSEGKVAARDLAVLDAAVKAWGSGMYEAQPLAEVQGLGSPLPMVPVQKLPNAVGGHALHAGFTPELMDQVLLTKGNGTPAFFGGPELKDMHVLVYRHKDGNGNDVTHGETYLKGDGYSKVVSWLKKHSGKAHAAVDDKATTYEGSEGLPGPAPPSSPDRGGLTGEREFYNKIIKAARTVSRHKTDGKYNADVLNEMEASRQKLEKLKEGAEAVLASPDLPPDLQVQMQDMKDMANHNLGLIAQVQKAKDGSYGFKSGDLPRWLPKEKQAPDAKKPEDELAKLGYKVTFGTTDEQPKGEFNGDKHEFVPSGSGHVGVGGSWWTLALDSGEKITVGNGKEHGVELVNHGRVRFTTSDHSVESLSRIRQAMQHMGLEMREAEGRDFETFYWRHLLAMLDDRSDGHNGKRQEVWDELKHQFAAHGLSWTYGNGNDEHGAIIKALQQLGETSPEAETDAYRHAFAKLTSDAQVADWAERGGFLPHLKHFDPTNPDQVGGKPDWYRFDVAPLVPTLPMPIRQTGHPDRVAIDTVKNGGSFALNALRRMFGFGKSTKGNPDDTGGPNYVFTRVNVSAAKTVFTPLALARSHNYSFADDSFGHWEDRKHGKHHGAGSPWDPAVWSKYTGSVNETMISDALSFLDDVELVEAANAIQRDTLIKWLKDRGITHIRFMPVEDRIVLDINSSSKAKVKDNYEKHPELLDPLAEPYLYGGSQGQAPVQQAAAESKAAAEALDTSKAVAAADAGIPAGKHETFTFKNGERASLPSGWTAYKSTDTGHDMNKLWAKDSAGQWWVIVHGQPAKKLAPDIAEMAEQHVGDGSFVPADKPGASSPPGGVGGWTEKTAGGHHWVSGNGNFKILNNSVGTFALYENEGYGWDDPTYIGNYDTLIEAMGQAENPGPPF